MVDKSFAEIKLFQVKPDKTEEFEAMIERMSAAQAKWEGCISIRYLKRFFTIDGVELGNPPREVLFLLGIRLKGELREGHQAILWLLHEGFAKAFDRAF